mmetsp:Transcript_39839/g.84950  ORF Transcript_39839/g.84950 Transcript_39839/m.84950 type:complete len:229 (+) Transcript_39839:700-1386(+)
MACQSRSWSLTSATRLATYTTVALHTASALRSSTLIRMAPLRRFSILQCRPSQRVAFSWLPAPTSLCYVAPTPRLALPSTALSLSKANTATRRHCASFSTASTLMQIVTGATSPRCWRCTSTSTSVFSCGCTRRRASSSCHHLRRLISTSAPAAMPMRFSPSLATSSKATRARSLLAPGLPSASIACTAVVCITLEGRCGQRRCRTTPSCADSARVSTRARRSTRRGA